MNDDSLPLKSTTGNVVKSIRTGQEQSQTQNTRLLAEWSRLAGADCAGIVDYIVGDSGQLLALFPPQQSSKLPQWLEEFLKCILRSKNPEKIKQLSFSVAEIRYQAIIVEISVSEETRKIAVFCFESIPEKFQVKTVQNFAKVLSLNEEMSALESERAIYSALSKSVDTSSEVNRALKYRDAAMKLVNAVAVNWNSTRVSLGMLRDWGVKISAISNIGAFETKMQLLKDLKETMLESIDQDIEVIFPTTDDSPAISRAASILCKKHGMMNTLALPIRYGNKTVGALLLERDSTEVYTQQDSEAIRMMLELVSGRLVGLEERSRWFGGRALLGLKRFFAILFGVEHTWTKLIALMITVSVVFFAYAKGEYNVDASFVLEPEQKRIIAAPYNSFLKDVLVKPSDKVVAGETLLGELETDDIVLQRAGVFADQLKFAKEASLARSEDKTVESQIAEAKAREAAARLALLNLKLEQAKMVAPVSGYISSKEIDLQIGSPLAQGDVLFEILPNDNLEVQLYVPEGDIADIHLGQQGSIAVMGYPDRKVEVEVFHISPVSQLNDDRNTFKVKAHLANRPQWMKPGMEGVAKIAVGERHLIWIWTKSIVNWFRLKLWI